MATSYPKTGRPEKKCKINCFTRIDSMTFLRRYINPKKLHFWGEEKLVNYKNVIIKIQNVGNPT